ERAPAPIESCHPPRPSVNLRAGRTIPCTDARGRRPGGARAAAARRYSGVAWRGHARPHGGARGAPRREGSVSPINVVFTGATGRVGRVLVPAILEHPEFRLVGAVGRRRAGEDVALVLGLERPAGVRLTADVNEALAGSGAQVLIDYCAPEPAVRFCRAAVEAGVAVVMATTAMDPGAVEEIGQIAARNGVGAFLAPNLTLSGQLLFRCVELLRRYIGDVEIVDARTRAKLDAPSGTAFELAER